jgi:cob(I)alamin adenosyltransferase
MSNVATPVESASETKVNRTSFPSAEAEMLEKRIDDFDKVLPKLTKFILPVSVFLHCLRTLRASTHVSFSRVEVCRALNSTQLALFAGGLNVRS